MDSLFPVQIVLAEFDIDTGSCVRTRFPDFNLPCHKVASQAPGSPSKLHGDNGSTWEHYLADQMLPDGAEKHSHSKTVFVLNRPTVQTTKDRERFRVFVYRGTEAPRASSLTQTNGEDNNNNNNNNNNNAEQQREPSSAATPPPPTTPPLEFIWSRVNHPTLPDAFIPEELSIDVASGGLRIIDKYGTILYSDIAAQQHTVDMMPSSLPEPLHLFTRQLHEKHSHSKTVFVINRPTVQTTKDRERFRVFVYRGTAAPRASSLTQNNVEDNNNNNNNNNNNAEQQREPSSAATPPPPTTPPLEFIWSRVNHPTLPDAFIPEELSIDVASGGLRIIDKYGTILYSDIAAQQHTVDMMPSSLPEPLHLFTRQLQSHRLGGMWEDVAFDPTAEGAVTPSLIPSSQHHHHHHYHDPAAPASINHTGAIPPVALSSPGYELHGAVASPTSASAPPFVFVKLSPLVPVLGLSADEPLAVLMTTRDFASFSTIAKDYPLDDHNAPTSSSRTTTPVKMSTMLPSCEMTEDDALAFMRSGATPSMDLNISATLSESSMSNEENKGRTALFGLCAAITRKDAEVRRGGINKSVALIGPSIHLLEPFYDILVDAAEKCCEVKGKGDKEIRQQQEILQKVFDNILAALFEANQQCLRGKLTQLDRCAYAAAAGDRHSSAVASTAQVTCFARKHKVLIPHLEPTGFGSGSFAYHPKTSTSPLLTLAQGLKDKLFVLLAALLGRCRVVLYSRSLPSTNVSECVLALGALMEAVDARFVRQRVFPYSSINHMSLFDSIPGFVVGTLNPMFESQKTWWDVLVDVSDTEVTLSVSNTDIETLLFMNNDRCSYRGADKEAYRELHRGIVHRRTGLQASDQELECYVADYLQEYIRSCVTFAMFGSPRSSLFKTLPRKLMDVYPAAQRSRMERWIGTDLHDALLLFSRSHDATASFLVSCLRRSQHFEDFEIVQLVQEMLRSSHDRDLVLVLSQFALSLGGLAPLAAKMVHGSLAVRMTVITLMRKLETCTASGGSSYSPISSSKSAGRICVTKMNGLLLNIYETLNRDLPDTSMAY
ncbi:Hypothetical protein, putative [Bodo saltans]|uniref:Arf3-interacting protein 1 N-terminal domain-containing protein n=1 Tax=Bodo saltans TaxID=75058 RepID=A0A0S4IPH1_BODSA|nr:Hypothetical protein, putative [Bodo saltans]|eukprot:CUF85277.1 Hypothetical protein, putative [Bodo saltans]